MTLSNDNLKVAIAQIAPVWFDHQKTLNKIIDFTHQAIQKECQLVVFGEGVLPGYPFWLAQTDGAQFNNEKQKTIHAEYAKQAVQIERGDLNSLCKIAKNKKIAIYIGIIERPQGRGGHSLYCSMVYINQSGEIGSVHRKLMPTYEERLSWSIGDGHGLVTHQLPPFTLGGLNCWENWMPLARASLYVQGEDLHIAIWPGNDRNTNDLTPVIAKEGRSYVVSACGLMRPQDVALNLPELTEIAAAKTDYFANGGSCIAKPDGSWLIAPQVGEEGLYVAELDHQKVRKERQNFDPSGHYSRPDVLQLRVNRQRQSIAVFDDS